MSFLSCARKISAAVVVLFLITSFAAHAAVILPGGGVATPASVAPTGALLFGNVPVPFTAPGANGFSGTLTASVYAPDVTNPLGGVTFTYILRNNASSATAME